MKSFSHEENLTSDLRIKLPVFEGPLDLLLYLVKKEELDIYDIPIERITDQYFSYLQTMQLLDLDLAGEFLVMAATLLYIKSRTLLPKDQQPPEEEAEEDDPRWQLIRQLVEYKKFKDAAWQLHLRHEEQEKAFPRGSALQSEFSDEQKELVDLGIFDLINAFQKILERISSRDDLKEIFEDRFTVSDKIEMIRQLIKIQEAIRFTEIFRKMTSRTEVVVTFLALLELIRLRQLRVTQEEPFGEIEIRRAPTLEQVEDPIQIPE